jgi:hypothetical protein
MLGNPPTIELSTNATAVYVVLTTRAQGRFSENALLLEAGTTKTISFLSWVPVDKAVLELLQTSLRVEHLAENLAVRDD